MAIYAVVSSSGGVVQNTVIGDNIETVSDIVGDCVEATESTGPAIIGWLWDPSIGKFIDPSLTA